METNTDETVSIKVSVLTAPERALLMQMYRLGWYVVHVPAVPLESSEDPGIFLYSGNDEVGTVAPKVFNALKAIGYVLPVAECGTGIIYLANPDLFSVSGEIDSSGVNRSQLKLRFDTQEPEAAPGATISGSEGDSSDKTPNLN